VDQFFSNYAPAIKRDKNEKGDNNMISKKINKVILIIIACIIAYMFLLPLLFMTFTSFKSLSEALGSSTLLPQQWTLKNYISLFNETSSAPIAKWSLNTLIVTVSCTALRLFTSTLAAYALARLDIPFKKGIIVGLIWAMAIPEIVTYFPLFYIFKNIGMLNTYLPLILPSGAGAMTVYLIYQFMLSFPRELEEAAFVDGASLMKILVRIVVPSIKPILITQGFITFLGLYNTYLWPSLVVSSNNMNTLTLGVAALVTGENYVNPGLMMAATVVAVLPAILIFMFLNKYIVRGSNQSGIK